LSLNNKTVFVTGVTGTVGDRIALRLLKEGAKVRGLVRNVNQFASCEKLGIEPVLGDMTDRRSISNALGGVDFVVHAAAYLGEDVDLAIAANVHGVKNLADEALSADVVRLVHISTISVYGEPNAGVFDESSKIVESHPSPYVRTKAESERILRRAMNDGLTCVILRPGAICAEYNSHWGDKQVERMAQVDVVTWVHPEDIVPWIHTDNVAEMCVIALTHPTAANQTYNAIDGNYPEHEFRVRIARAMGTPLSVPNREAERATYSADRVVAELGYRPVRSFENTICALERAAAGADLKRTSARTQEQ
jgi:nucleoside-diphosphate-sugar epimerase